MYSRLTLAYYNVIGVTGLVATDPEEYPPTLLTHHLAFCAAASTSAAAAAKSTKRANAHARICARSHSGADMRATPCQSHPEP